MGMVEEIWKNDKGEYFGIHSGKKFEKSEVDQINGCFWEKPNHPTDSITKEDK